MTPQETLNFFETQLTRSAQGFEIARGSKNVQLAAMNARQMFKAALMCGLIKWRQAENPAESFRKALTVLDEASALITSWDSSFVLAENLPIARGALLASLLDVALDVPVPESADVTVDVQLDQLLAGASAAAPAQETYQLIAKLNTKKTALAWESYQTYFEIISNKGDSSSLKPLVDRGEALFAKRSKDAFFSGGDQTEGGGPDNALVVDYRLGVALKKAGYTGASIHAWTW